MAHLALHGGTVVLAIIAQLCSMGFHSLVPNGPVLTRPFLSSPWNVSHELSLDLSMAQWWAGGTWILIDIWTMAWLMHAMGNVFKRNVLGPVSCNPEIHPPGFYLLWTTISINRMLGVFFGSILFSSLLPVPSFIMLFMSYHNLDQHKAWLSINSPREMWNIRYLTQNGLALFAWWVLLEFVVDIGFTLTYTGAVKDPLASTIVLFIIVSCAAVWFLLQISLLSRCTRYTFTVYPALILGLGAMFSRSYRIHNFSYNTVLCGFAMLLLTILGLIHLTLSCRRVDRSSPPLALIVEGCETVCKPEGKSIKL